MDFSVPKGQKTSINWQSLQSALLLASKKELKERYFVVVIVPVNPHFFSDVIRLYKEKLEFNNDVIFGRKCSVCVIRHISHSMEMIGQVFYHMHNIVCIYNGCLCLKMVRNHLS